MSKLLFLTLTLLSCTSLFGQNDSLRSATHIFWNEENPILMENFEDTIGLELYRVKCDSIDLCWGAYVGLWAIIDEPKKRRQRGKLIEKAYFVPAFEVANSYRYNNDTADYLTQMLVFDVYELTARKCRRDLAYYYKEMPYYGTQLFQFKAVESKNKEVLRGIIGSITHDIYVEKKENAYNEWRKTIDDLLEETAEYKTTNDDRIRFITNKPILEDYQKAEIIYEWKNK